MSLSHLVRKIIEYHRRRLELPWRCSASAMYAYYDLPNIDTVIRRSLFEFIQRLSVSQNSIVRSIVQSWFVRIKLWDFWTKILTSNCFKCISNCIINRCLLYLRKKILLMTDKYISICVFYVFN